MNIIFAIAITTARMHLVLGKVLMLPKAGFNCYGKPKTSNDLPTLHMYSVQNFFFTSRASCRSEVRRIQLSTRRVWQRPHGHGGLRVASPAWGPPQKAPRPHHAHVQCTELLLHFTGLLRSEVRRIQLSTRRVWQRPHGQRWPKSG